MIPLRGNGEANCVIEVPLARGAATEVDVLVTAPSGATARVPAFLGGDGLWRVRYASPLVGSHTLRTACPEAPELDGLEGAIDIAPYEGGNPLLVHGAPRVAESRGWFEHEDGTPLFWLADTWWMGLCARLEWPRDFETLLADRTAKGFTVVQIVAGLYPDMPAFDERGANEAGFPWESDWSAIRPEYFDLADRRIARMVEAGIAPCIVGAWGYFLPWMGVELLTRHWREVIARWGAYPVFWCIAGEANLPWYLAEGFPYDDREQVHGWTEVARRVREMDPFGRPITIHPTGLGRLSARGAIDDQDLLDFDMLQTGHGGLEVLEPSIDTLLWSRAQSPAMPVLNGEVSYEMLLGTIPAEPQRAVFWASLLSGAAGQTYGANGIWQANRADRPHGASPHGGDYGQLPWEDAMRLPGSEQLALAKRVLLELGWPHLTPEPELVAWSDGAPGRFGNYDRPYAARFASGAVCLYAPDARPVTACPGPGDWSVRFLDPTTGESTPGAPIEPREGCGLPLFPPTNARPDWVALLSPR